ncbi:MAG: site-specific DNA-methyltransferase, partial [Deltaproteobacteria bacterium]|nr:site-specific DNA-methyltransferase [Deltaproteobacteria bacterium]
GSLVRQSGSSGEFLDQNIVPRKDIDGLSCLYKVDGIGEDGLGYRYMTGPKKQTATKGKFYSGIPLKTLDDIKSGNADKALPIQNLYDLAGSFGNCRHEGGVDFRGGKKPEELLHTILKHFSNPGDLILDSFLGSGTTTAVAHKMGRRWIGVELGDHCHTHCIPRMTRIIDGEDNTGVTDKVEWKGGGGFRYYRLGPSLIVEDEWGNPVINQEFNSAMLAEAVCKLEGFEYAPSDETYWIHGQSTEQDFIYITTQFMSKEMLTKISDEVGSERSLLICCSAFRCNPSQFPNLTVKKIPKAVLKKCEWGHDDYSLEIKNLPDAPPELAETKEDEPTKPRRKFGKENKLQANLFGEGGDS